MKDNVLSLSAYESEYKILVQNKNTLEEILKSIDKRIKLNLVELTKTSDFNLLEFLKREFGNKLEVVEGE